ncbi:3-keto-disaccharide hydrolase [Terriglobus tenax]|uniref:3-keto-disaccharide hydrolase n=1 Tax=Terriglobus tenax TaxID=1111115 RepID=UPI0021E0D664|nr:DUF1080 domain-containing protein [Terriglobus tenax]
MKKLFSIPMHFGAAALMLMAPLAVSQAPAGGPPPGFNPRGSGPYDYADNTGFTPLFDGKTLKGWDGDTALWSVKDDSIYIHPSCEHPTGTVYLIWQGGEPGDFILKYDFKGTERVNGGMQFRSYLSAKPTGTVYPPRPQMAPRPPAAAAGAAGQPPRPAGPPRQPACANPGTPPSKESQAKWDLFGPQADFDAPNMWSGMFYEQGGRSIISPPGHVVLAEPGKPTLVTATVAEKAQLTEWFKKDDWNTFMIVAKGNTVQIFMNGHLTTSFTDLDPKYFRASGKLGIEVESTGEYWVKNVYLKELK